MSDKKIIGMIVAVELEAVFKHYGNCEKLKAPKGYNLYRVIKDSCEIYILHAGMGEIDAAAGVQFLITGCGAEQIYNFGVVGGLTPEMKKHKLCIVDKVVHYKYDCSEFMNLAIGQVSGHDSIFLQTDRNLLEHALIENPNLMPVICCSGDKFVSTPEEKHFLHERFKGDICDMESAGYVLACELNDVPCIMIKAVSDGLMDGAKGFYDELLDASIKCLETMDRLI